MKIAVIGAGAMGSIYGGLLSQANDVLMVDSSPAVVERIRSRGVCIEDGSGRRSFFPRAALSGEAAETVDLVILFVKALYSDAALEANRGLIGDDTWLMTLQNGAGHQDILSRYAPKSRCIIGTTGDNGRVLEDGAVARGGTGITNIGMAEGPAEQIPARIAEAFRGCGFDLRLCDRIEELIWNKLFINVSLSAVTALLQVDMGYVAQNEHAFELARTLLHEAVTVAESRGISCDEEALIEQVRKVSLESPHGVTSIRADIAAGRRTEVDTISGAVVKAARRAGIPVPCTEFAVREIHALEGRQI